MYCRLLHFLPILLHSLYSLFLSYSPFVIFVVFVVFVASVVLGGRGVILDIFGWISGALIEGNALLRPTGKKRSVLEIKSLRQEEAGMGGGTGRGPRGYQNRSQVRDTTCIPPKKEK